MKKLCQVSGKHTVGGIVFYKHLCLVRLWFPFRSSPMSDFGKNRMNIQSNKRIQNILSILFCYSLEIMSHDSVYLLKKLSKKLPPGCSKLQIFGFGKQVATPMKNGLCV